MIKYSIILFHLTLLISCSNKLGKYNSNPNTNINFNSYYLTAFRADSLALIGHYEESFLLLDSLFRIYKPINIDNLYEFETYLKVAGLTQRDSIIKKNIVQAVRFYGISKHNIDVDKKLREVFEKSEITEEEYSKLRKEYIATIDLDLRKKVFEMVENDQKYYQNEVSDSLNFDLLIRLFNDDIFPSQKVIGHYTVSNNDINISAVLLHVSDSIQENIILPKLLEFSQKGLCDPYFYPLVYDQIQVKQHKEIKYGVFRLSSKPLTGEDTVKININRKKIGLPSLKYDALRKEKIFDFYYN